MSRILPQPFKHPKTSIYYFRKVIPVHLRPAFGGRTELRKSLGTKDWRQAKLLHALAIADAERLLVAALSGSATAEPVPPTVAPPASKRASGPKRTRRAARHGESFEDLVDRWIAEVKPLPKSGYSKRRMARALAVFVRHDRPGELTRRDVLDWKEAMISQGLHHKTINSRLSALRALFKWGVKNERLASNPFVGVTMEARKVGAKARLPYTDEEAKLILHAARGQSGFRRWVPLVLAYSGARLDEICQCFGRDIRREGDIWFVDINDNDETKALKNGAHTVRKVPIHEQVIAEGFLDYVQSVRADEPLFPDIKPDKFGRRGGNASKVLGRWVRSLGINDRRKAPNHSWRHRFKDLCRAAGIEKSIHDALTGHASRDVGDGYGLGYPLTVLIAAIAKLP